MDSQGKIDSEEEYWKEYKKFKKKMWKVRSEDDFNKVFDEAYAIGLFKKEDINQLKQKFRTELGMASVDKVAWVKEKVKNRLKRRFL